MLPTTVLRSFISTLSSRASVIAIVCAVAIAVGDRAYARQTAPAPTGHWIGNLPAGPGLDVEVDLVSKGSTWSGTISIPAQGTRWIPLAELSIKGTSVSFAIKGAPGDPRFAGTLSADGKTITGDFTQGGGTLPLTLTWKGEPKFEVRDKSTPVAKEVEGSWEGALDVKGQILRLILKVANGASGATGTLVSLDQGNLEIPISTITQQGSKLKLTVTMISGTFEGEVTSGEIAGTWTQGPLSLPLVFKRSAK
jgi:hypothetical protein